MIVRQAGKTTVPRKSLEHIEQAALFTWARLAVKSMPELELLYAIPNGGMRNIVTAAKLKAEGVKAGVPDIALDVARAGYHGLRIELKVWPNKLTQAQSDWMTRLSRRGYLCHVAYSWPVARWLIVKYLSGQPAVELIYRDTGWLAEK